MTFETKFRNFVGRIEQLSKEEVIILSRGLLVDFNREKNYKEKPNFIENDYEPDENWDKVNEQIEKSKIRRYRWNEILGDSLTNRTLKLRKKGLDSNQTIDIILRSPGVISFLEKYPEEEMEFIRKLKIGVSSRYAENKTAEKVKDENETSA